jgi:hypothetical protein
LRAAARGLSFLIGMFIMSGGGTLVVAPVIAWSRWYDIRQIIVFRETEIQVIK